MADEIVIEEPKKEAGKTFSSMLQESVWEDKPMPTEQTQKEVKKEEPKVEKKEEVQVQPEAWFKQYGFEDEGKAKETIDTWKKAIENPVKEEIKFANDQSKQLFEYLKEGKEDEALEILSTKKKIDKLTSGDVTEANAADIIKLSIKNKYKEFDERDIDRKFNKQYAFPKEPSFDETKETEVEFKERHQEWKDKVQETKDDLILDAKMAKTELQKLKSELVLPDISKPIPNSESKKELTQEELQALKKSKEDWVKAANASATDFSGLTTTAKYKDGDKDVEIPISYGLSEDEKKSLTSKLNEFAENNFDPYTILKDRWVNADGSDNINQVVKDLSWLMYGERAAQKFATDASNQRMELYLKEKKNIKIDGVGSPSFANPNGEKSKSEKLQEEFWK